jgi:hypothetical protein
MQRGVIARERDPQQRIERSEDRDLIARGQPFVDEPVQRGFDRRGLRCADVVLVEINPDQPRLAANELDATTGSEGSGLNRSPG